VARLKSKLGTQAPEFAQRLQHLTETLNSGIALKRRIIEDLRPSSLFNLGLTASLEILAREFAESSGIDVATNLETVELNDSSQLTVYRLVQESLTNVGKYAQAEQVDIMVKNSDGQIGVEIRDNGLGFETSEVRTSTHGLAGMKHRVEAAGGRLSVESQPGEGTRIIATLPRSTQPA
jgi:signal transduction histidine kinase